MFRFISLLLSGILLSSVLAMAQEFPGYENKLKGGWIGQMAGVGWGAPTEFFFKSRMIPDSAVPVWMSAMINDAFHQDDLTVELPFLQAAVKYGLNAPLDSLCKPFRQSTFSLAHGNKVSRDNLQQGYPAWVCGYPAFNRHYADIDWQIETDWIGMACPGRPEVAAAIAFRLGHAVGYGEGVLGGVMTAALYAGAFTERNPEKLLRRCVPLLPAVSGNRKVLEEVLLYHSQNPDDWRSCWKAISDKWLPLDVCPRGRKDSVYNIDAKLNMGYVAIGLLYGKGDFENSVRIAMQCGEDSDCNPSTVGGVLGVALGYSGIPEKFRSGLDFNMKFSHTPLGFEDCLELTRRLEPATRLNGKGTISIPEETDLPQWNVEWPGQKYTFRLFRTGKETCLEWIPSGKKQTKVFWMKGSSQTGTGRLILNAGDLITLMIFESGKAPFWKEFRAEELMKRLAGKPETFLEILPFPKDGLNTASLRIQDFGKEIPAGYREGTFCPPRFLQAKSSGSGPLFFPFYQRGKFGPGSGKAGVKLENLLHGQIRNRKDLEAKAEVEVNAEGIGLHFFITDDSLINEAPLPWDKGPVESVYIPTPADDDAVEIFFDVRKEGNPYYGAGVFHFAFKAGDENLWLDNRLQTDTRGIRNRYIPTSNGYERQLFFLWSSLGLSTKPSTGFHFNLNVSDDDNGRARDKTLSLFPAHGYGWADAMEMGEMDLR